MRITYELSGMEALDALPQAGLEAVVPALSQTLYREAEAVMAESKRIVPVETGALRASGQVQPPEVEGTRVSVRMGYGNAAVPYAVYVHERLDLKHKPPTQAKFLEIPARAKAIELGLVLADKVASALRRLARR